MNLEELFGYVLPVLITLSLGIITFWLGRRISKQAEVRAREREEMQEEMSILRHKCATGNETIRSQEAQIMALKLELEQKDKKIAELREQLRFAERTSERDIKRLAEVVADINAKISELRQFIEERGRRGKE